MNQPANLNLFELLNWCIEHQPSALGIFVLNPRVERIKFLKRPRRVDGAGKLLDFERVSLVTFELPERVGENLRGPEEDHALLFAFSVDRAIYDAFLRRAALAETGIILPPGARI